MLHHSNIIQKKVVGIGLGPSNLALAISLYEDQKVFKSDEWIFLEKKDTVAWHPGMMLEGAKLQVPFAKDLVTLRNPTSHFSFLNYLKKKGRLDKFINNGQNSPTRFEYEDYLKWTQQNLPNESIEMNAEVLNVEPYYEDHHSVSNKLLVTYEKKGEIHHVLTEQLVIGTGGSPKIPSIFKSLDQNKVWHSSSFKQKIENVKLDKPQKIGVIGSGQSAAEIIDYLHDLSSNINIYSIMRRPSFRPEDDSPFVNEVFFPHHVDFMYSLTEEKRKQVLSDYWHANYSAVNINLINSLYEKLYADSVESINRVKFLNYQQTVKATQHEQIRLDLKHLLTEEVSTLDLDYVILATGYDRLTLPLCLNPLKKHLCCREDKLKVNRHYKVETDDNIQASIYVQGMSESIHGITNTLLSILPIRAGEIVEDLMSNQTFGNDSSQKVEVF